MEIDAGKYTSPDDLIADTLGEGVDFTLPSGKLVLVRGLSRYEQMVLGKGDAAPDQIEARMISFALLAPVLSPAKVAKWQSHSAAGGDIPALTTKIRELSGMAEGAGKSDVPGDGDD